MKITERKKKNESFPCVAALCLFVLAGILHTVKPTVPLIRTFIFVSCTLIYLGLIICWAVYIAKRFISNRIRSMLVSMAFCLLIYILIRTVKYRYISSDYQSVTRFLWYCYYVPQVFAPLISFMTACTVGKPEDEKLSKWWTLAFAAAAFLAFGILTNDFHQLAFRFGADFINWESDYSYGFLFYAVTVWIYSFLFASILMLWHKCKVASIRNRVWLPFIWLPVGTLFVIMLALESITRIESIFELPELHCFILAAMWESCIQIGLIPCNTGYSECFSNSSLAVQIADSTNTVMYRSKNAPALTKEQMQLAKNKPVLISKNTLLHSNTVMGGNIFWSEDLTTVNKMNEELSEIGERLSEESDLLRAENEIKEQKARLDEQNRLYDGIALLVKPQLDAIAKLLESEGDFKRNMSLACVLNCYVKRRANLTLLADSSKFIDARELYLSIKESTEYLNLCGISSNVGLGSDALIPSQQLLLAFDIWQLWVEAGLLCMSAIMANIYSDSSGLVMKLTVDGCVSAPTEEKYRDRLNSFGGKLKIDSEDGTVFACLSIPKGGDRK